MLLLMLKVLLHILILIPDPPVNFLDHAEAPPLDS